MDFENMLYKLKIWQEKKVSWDKLISIKENIGKKSTLQSLKATKAKILYNLHEFYCFGKRNLEN